VVLPHSHPHADPRFFGGHAGTSVRLETKLFVWPFSILVLRCVLEFVGAGGDDLPNLPFAERYGGMISPQVIENLTDQLLIASGFQAPTAAHVRGSIGRCASARWPFFSD
jgi:hypothetical protein